MTATFPGYLCIYFDIVNHLLCQALLSWKIKNYFRMSTAIILKGAVRVNV